MRERTRALFPQPLRSRREGDGHRPGRLVKRQSFLCIWWRNTLHTIKEPLQNVLGKLLRKERKHQDLTQQEMAYKAGLPTPTVRLLENGKGGLQSWSNALEALKLRLYGRNLPRQDGIGAQVAEIRKRRGLGQRALAQMVQVTNTRVAAEKGIGPM